MRAEPPPRGESITQKWPRKVPSRCSISRFPLGPFPRYLDVEGGKEKHGWVKLNSDLVLPLTDSLTPEKPCNLSELFCGNRGRVNHVLRHA